MGLDQQSAFAPCIAQFLPVDAIGVLAGAKAAQPADGGLPLAGLVGAVGHQTGQAMAMASDQLLLPPAHRVKQLEEVGFGLEGANGFDRLQPVANQFIGAIKKNRPLQGPALRLAGLTPAASRRIGARRAG